MGLRATLALLGTVAFAAVGCAGGSEPEVEEQRVAQQPEEVDARAMLADAAADRPMARPGVTPPGFRRRTATADGFSIALPRRWHALRPSDARSPGVLQTLGRARVGLRPYLMGLSMPDSPLRLLGFAPGEGDFATTITVLVSSMPEAVPYAQWSHRVVKQVRTLSSLRGEVRVRHLRLAAGEALRLDYERRYRSSGHRVATTQVVVASGERLFTLTLATRPNERPVHTKAFAAAARSLTISY